MVDIKETRGREGNWEKEKEKKGGGDKKKMSHEASGKEKNLLPVLHLISVTL